MNEDDLSDVSYLDSLERGDEGGNGIEDCPICWEYSERIMECGCSTKEHKVCHECLESHCTMFISHHKVPIPCPVCLSASEPVDLPNSTVYAVAPRDSKEGAKFTRLMTVHKEKKALFCPRCDEVVRPPSDNSPKNSRTCISCTHSFCAIHGDAHPDSSCQEYTQKLIKENNALLATNSTLRKHTRQCSHCKAVLFKASGCNYVVCPKCHRAMCFGCGKHDKLDTQTHICRRCRGEIWSSGFGLCFSNTLLVLFGIIFCALYPMVVLALILVTGCCCGGFLLGSLLPKEDEENKGFVFQPLKACLYLYLLVIAPFTCCCDSNRRIQGFHRWFRLFNDEKDLPVLAPESATDPTRC